MSSPDVFSGGEARIIDRGYRGYDGARTGTRGAVWALTRHSIARGLGLRRTIWAKALPVAAIAIAYIPAIVFVGVVALVPSKDISDFILPTYGQYYGYVITAITLFVGLAAPEMLCTDRRTGMLGVYLASPLNRDSYLVAKSLAVAFVLSLVCIGPTLLMLIANILQSSGPDGFGDIMLTLVRVIGAGLVVTVLYTAVTVGLASLTDRKAIASALIILVFLVSLTVVGGLSSAGAGDGVGVGSVTNLSLELAIRVHGERGEVMPGAPSATVWVGFVLWVVGGFALARFRLKHLPVTR